MVSLIKNKAILWLSIAIFAFIFAGCDSSDNDSSVPLAAPTDMGLDARSGIITIQFSKIDGIGAEGEQNLTSYDVFIGTKEDGSDMEELGVIDSGGSNLVRLNIVRTVSGNESGTVFHYPGLTDGKTYWIFIRTDFATSGYGKSKFAKISAVPIPMPTAIEDFDIAFGDQRIVLSWKAKEYEEYGINTDCPGRVNQLTPGFWNLNGAIVTGNNYVHTLADNAAEAFFCIAATNVNGNGEWYLVGTTPPASGDITYAKYTGTAATSAPAAPAVTIVKNANKRVDISFPVVMAGAASASDYQYAYKVAGTSTWSNWDSILITSLSNMTTIGVGTANASVANLENSKTYDIKVRAVNTKSTGVEGTAAAGKPVYTELNFNNPDEYLSKANAEYIYAEDVPHSDFWRISETYKQGGRPSTDRLVRGKETALGNLFADAVQWYAKEQLGKNTDFAWLMGDMISTGIQNRQTITPKFLQSIITSDYLDDTLVIITVKGDKLISQKDYDLDLNAYPAVGTNNGYATTLFGQAAATYRNGHYGGSGGTTYNGKVWGIPSKEVRYTIEYLPYSLTDFDANFTSKPGCVAARNLNDGKYDSVLDDLGCYLMPYEEANPASGNPTEASVMGYKRGKIKDGTLTINGSAVVATQDYTIITTKRLADTEYVAFLGSTAQNTGVTLVRAVAEYIYNEGSAGMTPYLDGRVKIEGGVPGKSANDFK